LKIANFFAGRIVPLLLSGDLMLVLKDSFSDSEIIKDKIWQGKKFPKLITGIIYTQIKLNLNEKMKDSKFNLI